MRFDCLEKGVQSRERNKEQRVLVRRESGDKYWGMDIYFKDFLMMFFFNCCCWLFYRDLRWLSLNGCFLFAVTVFLICRCIQFLYLYIVAVSDVCDIIYSEIATIDFWSVLSWRVLRGFVCVYINTRVLCVFWCLFW